MTHNVVVNGRFLSRRVTGVERFGREILKCFGEPPQVLTTRFHGVAGHAWEQFILPTKLPRKSVLWSPANTGPLLVREQALTIHDLSPLNHPEWFQPGFALWYRLFLPLLVKRVKVVFVPSEYVKQKVLKRFDLKRVIVSPNGVDTSIFHPEAKQQLDGLPARYVLFVGSLQPRKNLGLLLNAWQEIAPQFPDIWLVLAGTTERVFRSVNLSVGERVQFLGYVPDEALPGLYAHAEWFVLPSFDEGFGLPALEAMACGTPVIVSDGGALAEVVGDAGLIFRLAEPQELAEALRRCLSDRELRMTLKEKGLCRARRFSWNTTAELIWKTLNEI